MTATQTKFMWLLLQKVCLSFILVLNCDDKSVTGMLTLSPMSVAPVCNIGDPLQLTCIASVEFMRWSVLRFNEQGILEKITNDVTVNSRDPYNQMTPAVVNSATFTFIRSSAQEDSPLISTLSIDSVNIGLNGTIVQCMDVANPTTLASTIIQIIDISQNIQYAPTLSITEKHYGTNNAIITVEWAQLEGVMYIVNVSPLAPIISTGSTSLQLTISYNTKYNLSVVASTLCRPNATAFIILNYAKCGHPELMPVCTCSTDSVPRVVGYNDVPVEGSTIRFSCLAGLELTGPNSATCTGNGEWEPDPSGVMCNESKSDAVGLMCNDSKGSFQEMRPIECSLAAAVSSSVLTFLIASIIIFIAGFMFGQYFRLSKGTLHITTADHPRHQGPVYDTVQPASTQQENLELKVNVAYHGKVHHS